MNVSGFDSNSIGMLFSSVGNNTSRGNGLNFGVDLSTYGLIKSGTYGKLMRSYYSTGEDATGVASAASTSVAKDSAKVLTSIKGAASDLADSATKLYKPGKDSVFNETDITDKDGKTKKGYDMDAIYKAVSDFVDDYNSTVKAAGKTNTSSIANAGASMINYTNTNANLLKSIGISADATTHELKVDEDTFKKASISKIKSAFSGSGSFAYSVAVKASMLKNYAEIESSKSNTYGNRGNYTYNYMTGEMYNSEV